MPKLKQASLSLAVSRAKKPKRTQREDPIKHQQERQRDSLRHQRDASYSSDRHNLQDSEERRRQRDAEVH